MNSKSVLTGLATGVLANIAGIIFYLLVFSETTLVITLNDAMEKGYLGKIICLGAALNFLPFFLFINRNIYLARGVLLATLLTAVVIAGLKFL